MTWLKNEHNTIVIDLQHLMELSNTFNTWGLQMVGVLSKVQPTDIIDVIRYKIGIRSDDLKTL